MKSKLNNTHIANLWVRVVKRNLIFDTQWVMVSWAFANVESLSLLVLKIPLLCRHHFLLYKWDCFSQEFIIWHLANYFPYHGVLQWCICKYKVGSINSGNDRCETTHVGYFIHVLMREIQIEWATQEFCKSCRILSLFKGQQSGLYLLSLSRTKPQVPMSHMIGWKHPSLVEPYR